MGIAQLYELVIDGVCEWEDLGPACVPRLRRLPPQHYYFGFHWPRLCRLLGAW